MKGKKIVSTLLALLLLTGVPVSALAAEWDISKGDITVNAGSGGQTVTQGGGAAVVDSAPVITGSSQDNTLTINAEKEVASRAKRAFFAACQPANPAGFTLGKQGGLEPLCACWGNLSPRPFARFLQNRLRSCGAFFACGVSENRGIM